MYFLSLMSLCGPQYNMILVAVPLSDGLSGDLARLIDQLTHLAIKT